MAKIAIISIDPIGEKMAGPGIRYWEMAKFLSDRHQVTLVIPNSPDRTQPRFSLMSVADFFTGSNYDGFDFIIGQDFEAHGWKLLSSHARLILDAYIPLPTEGVESAVHDLQPNLLYQRQLLMLEQRLTMADHILCASIRQADMYFGMLLSLGKLNPHQVLHLRNTMSIVPFGLNDTPPTHTRQVLKGVHPGIAQDDVVIIWNGGIWNWFDPLSLIRAVASLVKQQPKIKLFFMGVQHPNKDVPSMRMVTEAIELAQELGLYDTHVFFNMGWVDYDDRQNYLLESDLSVCLTPEGVENDFSFRTRILDCFWAGVPVIINQGSSLSEVVADHGLGRVLTGHSAEEVADAIQALIRQRDESADLLSFELVNHQFQWSAVFAPLSDYIEGHPQPTTTPWAKKLGYLISTVHRLMLGVRYKFWKILKGRSS